MRGILMEVVSATTDMADELSDLINEVILDTPYYEDSVREIMASRYSRARTSEGIESGNGVFLAAVEDDKIIGFCVGTASNGVFWGYWAGVSSSARRRGVAMQLVRQMEEELRWKEIHKVGCVTRTNNIESISLLVKAGFEMVALHRKHWWGHDFYEWAKFI